MDSLNTQGLSAMIYLLQSILNNGYHSRHLPQPKNKQTPSEHTFNVR